MLLQLVYMLLKKAISVEARMMDTEMGTHPRSNLQMADLTSLLLHTRPHRLVLVARDACPSINKMETLDRVVQVAPKPRVKSLQLMSLTWVRD